MNKAGFSKEQIRQIEEGEQEGLDVSVYAKPAYTAMHMQEIKYGLEKGLDVSLYADPAYDWFQMEQIRKGIEDGVDVSAYAAKNIPFDKMREVRRGLKRGIHLERYLQLEADMLCQIRNAIEQGVNIQPFLKAGCVAEQLEQIIPALKEQLDIAPYVDTVMRGVAIREIRLGMEHHVDVSCYASAEYSWRQMREIRVGLEHGVDVSVYRSHYYEFQQMREIRMGLEHGVDVSGYAHLRYTTRDMARMRRAAEAQLRRKPEAEQPRVSAVPDKALEAGGKTGWPVPVMISVTPDEEEAYIIADKSLQCYSAFDLSQALREREVVYGLDMIALERVSAGACEDGELVRVAKGTESEKGADGWYEYFFRTEIARTPKLLGNGNVDYQNIEWFETVEEGQKIAEYHPAADGKNGITVTGRIRQGKRGHELPVLTGVGWRLDANGRDYIAATGGCIQIQGNYIQISEMYVFDNITRSTGNVNEKGTVYIRGSVGSGAYIHAGRDIIVDGFIEGATLECDGEVFLRKGMNGFGRGSIRAGKTVTGSFFEGVSIYAEGDLTADYCMDCTIQIQGKLKLHGAKGALIGGQAELLGGMEVSNVGNGASVPTMVRIGSCGGVLEKERSRLESAIAQAKREIDVFRNAYLDFMAKYPPEVRNGMEMFIKVERAIYTKEVELNGLNERNAKLERYFQKAAKAVAVVRGVLYEGVVFEIGGRMWRSRKMMNVRIKKDGGRISIFTNG